jgi:hypothetical protein
MSSDLKVDYQLLESIHSTMTGLLSELENIQPQQGEYDGAMGSGSIAGAMDGFAGNWTYHRKQIIGNMQSLNSMVTESVQKFQQADANLKSQLTGK